MDNATTVANAVASSASSHSEFFDQAKTYILYFGILVASVITAFAGIRSALRDLRKGEKANAGGAALGPAVERLVGGTIMETTTLLMWSESNRSVAEAVRDLTTVLTKTCERIDIIEDLNKEASELRHQIERLRDKL